MRNHDRSRLRAGFDILASETGAGHRLRRYTRFGIEAEGWAHASPHPGGLDRSIPMIIRDISRVGAGILVGEPLSHGDTIPLTVCDGSVTVATLAAFVRRCHPVPGADGVFMVGLDFGIDAGILLSLGVPMLDIMQGNQPEAEKLSDATSFCAPEDINALDSDAA